MPSKKVESVKPVEIEPVAIEPVAEASEELLTDEEINEAVKGSAIAIIEEQELLSPIDLDLFDENEEIEQFGGLTRAQVEEMSATAEAKVLVEDALETYHRDNLQQRKATAAQKKLAALKKNGAMEKIVQQITVPR